MSEINMFPDDAPVLVRHPRTGEEQRPRDQWPWMAGVIEQRVGPDEWQVLVTDPQAADAEGYPLVFRDHTELKVRAL